MARLPRPFRYRAQHAFKTLKGTLGLTAAKVRTPEQADRWVRLVMAAAAQLLLARPLAADLRRPWEKRPEPGRPKGSLSGPAPRYPVHKKADSTDKNDPSNGKPKVKT